MKLFNWLLFCLWSTSSDFVINNYGESWDSFCEKSWVPVWNQWVPVKKKKESEIENAWAFMQPNG